MKSYFPDRLDADNLNSNSKNQFNSRDRLGNAALSDDSKPKFLSHFADWVESCSECPYFTLTKQTSHAPITTLRRNSSLIRDLLEGGYNYILTARFQSNPLERHFSKYRQIIGSRFLVSSKEVNNSEKLLKRSSVLKENIIFETKMCT